MAESSCGTGCLGLDLLVGSNYYWTLVTEAVKRGSAGPIAMETRVGWVLSGPMEDPSLFVNFISLESNHTLYVDNNDNSLIELGLNKFWNLESLGITSEESSVHQNFCDTITFKHGCYQVKLPWRDEHGELYDNFELSKNRLTSLLNDCVTLQNSFRGMIASSTNKYTTKLWNQSNF